MSETKFELIQRGAEAEIYSGDWHGRDCIKKLRCSKKYRHPVLDKSLIGKRTKAEARCMVRCKMQGILTPTLFYIDLAEHALYMERLSRCITVKQHIYNLEAQRAADALQSLMTSLGRLISRMHHAGIIHGDLTTSNMMLDPGATDSCQIYLIDFGLGSSDQSAEKKGVDLYVLERAFLSSHPQSQALFAALLESYTASSAADVAKATLVKLDEIRMRGRKRTMVG